MREYSSFCTVICRVRIAFARRQIFRSRPHLEKCVLRRPTYALSLKQPWATLVVAGLKSIEVRKWATSIRGRIYIHAARTPDARPEGWAHLSESFQTLSQLRGGIIGFADLTSCISYRTSADFAADAARHLNSPDWFEGPRMYGFTFNGAEPVPFVAWKGNVRFFTVEVPAAK